MTIVEAAIEVVKEGDPRGMALRDIYDGIVTRGLYSFNSESPLNILAGQVKRATEGINWATTAKTKVFRMVGNRFLLLDGGTGPQTGLPPPIRPTDRLAELREHYSAYCVELRERLLANLQELDPIAFESFARKLLEIYGFADMRVTHTTNDGGIDGHGKLAVGLAHMNVAFQCKRWKGSVGRPEVDRFRGAIQGQFEQGLFFTTSSFTKQAKGASLRPGAVPVVLLDGPKIVDLMIDREFGLEVEYIKVYEYALDKEIG